MTPPRKRHRWIYEDMCWLCLRCKLKVVRAWRPGQGGYVYYVRKRWTRTCPPCKPKPTDRKASLDAARSTVSFLERADGKGKD